jgi:hypothetical protein
MKCPNCAHEWTTQKWLSSDHAAILTALKDGPKTTTEIGNITGQLHRAGGKLNLLQRRGYVRCINIKEKPFLWETLGNWEHQH